MGIDYIILRFIPYELFRPMTTALLFLQLHEALSSRGYNKADLDDVQLLLDEGGGEEKDFGRILVLKINYHLQHSLLGVSAGLVFRQPCGESCGYNGAAATNPSASSSSASTSCSVYSLGGGTGMLRD